MARGKRIGLAGGILLLLFIIPSSIAAQDIQVPVEFFLGRWVAGHAFTDSIVFVERSDSVRSRPAYGYSSPSGSWRIGITALQKLLLIDNDSERDGVKTAVVSLESRLRPTWQVGLTGFGYGEWKRDWQIHRRLVGTLRSALYNRNQYELTPWEALYMYRVGLWLPKGAWSLITTVPIDHETYDGVYLNSFDYPESFGSKTSWSIRAQNRLTCGLNSRLLGWIQLGLRYTFERGLEVLPYIDKFLEEESRYLAPAYEIGFDTRMTGGLFAGLSIGQAFTTSDGKVLVYDESPNTRPIDVTESTTALTVSNRSVRGYLTLLTMGAFQPQVVLDDYSGLYGGMLFHRQMQTTLEFTYRHEYTYSGATLAFSPALGLFGRLQVAPSATYRWSEFRGQDITWSLESIALSIAVQWRSFEYRPGSGHGWDRDSKYDVLFGPSLAAGQYVFSCNHRPAAWGSYSKPGHKVFDLRSLTNEGSLAVTTLTGTIGLGRDTEAGVTAGISHVFDDYNLDEIGVSLSGRPLRFIHPVFSLTSERPRYGEAAWEVRALFEALL